MFFGTVVLFVRIERTDSLEAKQNEHFLCLFQGSCPNSKKKKIDKLLFCGIGTCSGHPPHCWVSQATVWQLKNTLHLRLEGCIEEGFQDSKGNGRYFSHYK